MQQTTTWYFLIFPENRTNSAEDKLMTFFLFFPENRIWYLMQTIPLFFPENRIWHLMQGDSLHQMSNPVFWEIKKKKTFKMSSTDIFIQYAKR